MYTSILALIIALAASTIALPAATSPIAAASSSTAAAASSTYSDPYATETPTVPPPGPGLGLGHGCTGDDCWDIVPRQDGSWPTLTTGQGSSATTVSDPFASVIWAGSPQGCPDPLDCGYKA